MTRIKIVIVLGTIFIFGMALLFFLVGSGEKVDLFSGENRIAELCKEDVLSAQEYSLDKVCTQGIQTLLCPHDYLFSYDAPNGCEISFLKEQDWIEQTTGDTQ